MELTLALAKRLELTEAADAAEFARETFEVSGGIAAFCGESSPLSHAVGLAMNARIEPADLDRVEAFYRERNAPPVIDLCPLAEPSLNDLLGRRGYRITEFNNVLVRALTPEFQYQNAAITKATDEATWNATVSEGFFERSVFTPEEIELASLFFRMPSGACWLATADGEPAAAAALSIQNRLARLFADSTRPRFRRRGLQTALIQARLAHAAAQGCDVATASTIPGSASQAHYERLGFRVAYTKLILTLL